MNKRVPTDTVIAILKNYKEYITPQAYESLELSYAVGRAVESLKTEKRQSCWISVDKTLPTEKDADIDGAVLGRWSCGAVREIMWAAVANYKLANKNNYLGKLISWARMPEVEDP